MDFISFKFIIFIALSLIIFYLYPQRYRNNTVIPFLNIFFILTFIKHIAQLLPLAFFLLTGFICIKMVERFPTRKTISLSVVVILLSFLYFKKYSFIAFIPFIKQPYLVVGLSYILFRVLHLLIDIYGNAIKEKISFPIFLGYSCFFLNFISGPIQRFQEYIEQGQAQGKGYVSQENAFKSFSRIINGYLKIVILSTAFLYIHNGFSIRIETARYDFNLLNMSLIYMSACVFYSLYLYYNFSGYMDVIIGIGYLFGFRLPENFNHPFASQSFLEFWSRWHITLSNWFKFYVFNPIVKAFAYHWPNLKLTPYYGVIGFFITFLLMGIWHGSSLLFIIYGIFLGLGMGINKFYEVKMRIRLGKSNYANMCNNKIYRLVSAGFTYSYFIIALSCIWMSPDKLRELLGKMGVLYFFVFFILSGLVSALAILFIEISAYFWNKGYQLVYFLNQNFYLQQSFLSIKALVLILFLMLKLHSIPEFIYKAF